MAAPGDALKAVIDTMAAMRARGTAPGLIRVGEDVAKTLCLEAGVPYQPRGLKVLGIPVEVWREGRPL